MKSRRVLLCVIFFVLICSSSSLAGGGFAMPGIGSKALNMGGAFRALADDWSAAFWNPAGLAYLPKSEFAMNLYTLNFRPEYTPNVNLGESGYSYSFGYSNEKQYPNDRAYFLPSFSGFHKFPQMAGFTGGVAFYAPYKLESRWDLYEPTSGYNNDVPYPQYEHVTDILIWDIHPSVAKTFMEEKLALGLGINIQRAEFELRKTVLIPSMLLPRPYDFWPVDSWIQTDGWGLGFNAGILYKASPKLQFGLSYQSPIDITLEGTQYLELYLPMIDVDWSDIQGGTYLYTNEDYETTLSLPGEIGAGIMFRPMEKLTLTADVSATNWSSLEYLDTKDINLTIDESAPGYIYLDVRDTQMPFNWDNITRFSVGAEYIIKEGLFTRGGYFFEQSPIPDNTFTLLIPDVGDKHSFNLGLSYQVDSFEFGYDYQLVMHSKREIDSLEDANNDQRFDNLPGEYKMLFHCSGLSFTYRF